MEHYLNFTKFILFIMVIFSIKTQSRNLLGTLSALQGLGMPAPARSSPHLHLCTGAS